MRAGTFFLSLFLIVLAAHLCHAGVLWTEEDLPLAAAKQILFGKLLYRDIWFDKPPLVPAVYLLWGAHIGFVLRFFGALYVFACCWVAWLTAKHLWGAREGYWAAAIAGFVLTFDTPSAVLPLAADMLMVLPHLAAMLFAFQKRPFLSGLAAGVGFLTNVKAALILVSCALFVWPAVVPLGIGFVLPILTVASFFVFSGGGPACFDQVWVWPSIYAGSSYVSNPVTNGFVRTLNWMGFHAGLLVAAMGVSRIPTGNTPKWKWAGWLILSFAGVAMGARFFPRYYFQLLPPLVLMAARGFVLLGDSKPKLRWAALVLFLIPLVRFGPRYPMLALGLQPGWADLALDRDSAAAAAEIRKVARPGDTLYVWGYRPDIFVYTDLRAASKYLDSQALTGVPADRHLGQSEPVRVGGTAEARMELARSRPTYVADGLGLLNPRLAMGRYPELREWLGGYREFGRTGDTVLWRRVER